MVTLTEAEFEAQKARIVAQQAGAPGVPAG